MYGGEEPENRNTLAGAKVAPAPSSHPFQIIVASLVMAVFLVEFADSLTSLNAHTRNKKILRLAYVPTRAIRSDGTAEKMVSLFLPAFCSITCVETSSTKSYTAVWLWIQRFIHIMRYSIPANKLFYRDI